VASEIWFEASEIWFEESEIWFEESEIWNEESEAWIVASEIWFVASETSFFGLSSWFFAPLRLCATHKNRFAQRRKGAKKEMGEELHPFFASADIMRQLQPCAWWK